MKRLGQSSKFLLLILDVVISLTLYFVGKYLPTAAPDVEFAIKVLQPVFIALILAIAGEDFALKLKTGFGGPREPPVQ